MFRRRQILTCIFKRSFVCIDNSGFCFLLTLYNLDFSIVDKVIFKKTNVIVIKPEINLISNPINDEDIMINVLAHNPKFLYIEDVDIKPFLAPNTLEMKISNL